MFGEEAPWIASAIASLRDQDAASRLVGASPRFRKAIERLPAIARASATVVITGEPGTGKTLVARAVHYLGPRAGRAFVPVRCSEQADARLELDLCEADGGSVFVDTVDRLAPRAQGTLVRMLQAADRTRLSDGRRAPDVRFIIGAGTPLPALVQAGRIRRDLYHCLSALTINLRRCGSADRTSCAWRAISWPGMTGTHGERSSPRPSVCCSPTAGRETCASSKRSSSARRRRRRRGRLRQPTSGSRRIRQRHS